MLDREFEALAWSDLVHIVVSFCIKQKGEPIVFPHFCSLFDIPAESGKALRCVRIRTCKQFLVPGKFSYASIRRKIDLRLYNRAETNVGAKEGEEARCVGWNH